MNTKISDEEISLKLKKYYKEHNPELIITKRISEKICPIILEGINNASVQNMNTDKVDAAVNDFLASDRIMDFVKSRQPNLRPITDDVIANIHKYFQEELQSYKVISVFRKSNHVDDDYLYMVIARMVNNQYACWSSWNQSREVLNHGHYCIDTMENCEAILENQFNDITDEVSKYGMYACRRDLEDTKRTEDAVKAAGKEENTLEISNVVPLYRHKSR